MTASTIAAEPRTFGVLRTVLERLLADPDAMVEDFVGEVRRIPSYGRGLVSEEEIRSSAMESLTLIMRAIIAAAETGRIELGNFPERLAASRANRRITVEDLADALRLDFTILWRHVRLQAREDELAALANDVELVWQVIEQYVRETRDRYREYVFAAGPDARANRQHHIGLLFGGVEDDSSGDTISRVAESLRLNAGQQFVVCVVRGEGFDPLRRIELKLENLNVRFLTWDRGTDIVFFWPAQGMLQIPSERARILEPIAHLPYAIVEPVDGLERVRSAADSARRLLESAPAEHAGPLTLLDIWPRIAANALIAVSEDVTGLMDAVDALPAGERGRILTTVRTFLDHGSVARCAEILFAHRNTVMNRLRRFHELTGLDPTLPREAALAVILLQHDGGRTGERRG